MIKIEKVIKANGELTETRKHPIEVADRKEMEAFRQKMEKHYGTQIVFIFREVI
jgi:GH25 family lysozyme M1 (1,4-beta-N-acetylmuramidase)